MEERVIVVDDIPVATSFHRPGFEAAMPLLVCLHGGTYTSAYFGVAGGPLGSFIDIALRSGFPVLTIDRPGYGGSGTLEDEENDFARQAEILDAVIRQKVAELGASGVVLVGHSIGGMIALEVAARRPVWNLLGVTVSGMGARIPAGGASEQLGAIPVTGMIDLPVPERDAVMFGPEGTFSEEARKAAHTTYALTPMIELKRAPVWARERLAKVAAQVEAPVQNFLAEFDALWDTSPAALADFIEYFADGAGATSEIAPRVGHSLDHHLLGASIHLKQLAFAYTCTTPTSA
ncbi:alpha/beta hydrolase family protein [Actinocorallia sp. A-T 12471]|uniref:alpha/beta hydrolase n=1 Tax=Actinocorallia sp. A-T 12471 TaxID=3089813 RepID=UPI0029D09B21|nr:alpha/beta hydrolase family protein [Actinocorallia sp. A-T 12471]MDX6742445.1 alpha/beta hydrolase family protein [Actinocorallia sp. A-T 12471]